MRHSILFALILALLMPVTGSAYFGQNKVQYKDFEWSILPTQHFDIHYYKGSEELAYMTAQWAEESHDFIAQKLGHALSHRIPLIIYGSHLDFEQTNTTYDFIDEGLQGFTEALKNRVVIHYQGSYADYKHLITHELVHAVMFDMIYTNSFSPQQYFMRMPLWFAEGLAEYLSRPADGWDTETEMFVREAVLSENLAGIEELEYAGGYMVYKEGQAIVRYIAKQFGDEKLGEIIEQSRASKSFDQAIQKALGLPIKQLSEEWTRLQKRHYWPQFAELQASDEMGRKLTDHEKEQSFLNMRPVFSPDGNQIAFFSDRKIFSSIYLLSTHDGKITKRLVKAQQDAGYESLHEFSSNMSWSPDGKQLAFVSKNEGKDHIYLYHVDKGKLMKKLTFEFDSIQSPDWSPVGDKIAFAAIKNGRRDLYVVQIETQELARLMDDRFDDHDPRWSFDGKQIVFSSDRPDPEMTPDPAIFDSTAGAFTYHDQNIYLYNMESRKIEPLVILPGNETQPCWGPSGDHVAFISDYCGTSNLFVYGLKDSSVFRLSNVTGGVFDPDWSKDGERIVVSSFQKWGWDLFILEDPLNNKNLTPLAQTTRLSPDQMAKNIDEAFKKMNERHEIQQPIKPKEKDKNARIISAPLLSKSTPLDSIYVQQGSGYRPYDPAKSDTLPEPADKTPQTYTAKLSPDYVSGGFAYANEYGFFGGTELYFSDILGDHSFQVLANLSGSIEDADIMGMYYYLPKRLDYGIGIFHEKNNFIGYSYIGDYYAEQREYGLIGVVSYPFSRFERVDLSMVARGINRRNSFIAVSGNDVILDEIYQYDQFLVEPSISLSKDNAIWGYTGPVGGTRVALSVSHSPGIVNKSLEYTTAVFDYRHYFRLSRRHQIAVRSLFALSAGPFAERFQLGGPYTMRGYNDTDPDLIGSKVGLVSMEFRFPFIDQIAFRWPLPIFFQSIRGAVFLDMGTAWNETENFRGASYDQGSLKLRDIKASYGIGVRIPFSFFILRFDLSNKTNFDNYHSSGIFQFSVGPDF